MRENVEEEDEYEDEVDDDDDDDETETMYRTALSPMFKATMVPWSKSCDNPDLGWFTHMPLRLMR